MEVKSCLRVERGAPAGDETQLAAESLVQLPEDERADVHARPLLCLADDVQPLLEHLAAALGVGLAANSAVHDIEQRRDAGENRRLHFGQPVADAHEVVLDCDRRAHGQRQQELDGERIGMMQWKKQQDAVTGRDRERLRHRLDVGHEVAVSEHHTLRAARCPRRIDDGCQVFRLYDRLRQRHVALVRCQRKRLFERDYSGAMATEEATAARSTRLRIGPDDDSHVERHAVGDLGQHLLRDDREPNVGPAQRVFDLLRPQIIVDGHGYAGGAGYPQIGDDPFQTVLANDSYLVAALQPRGDERRPEGTRLLPELHVGQSLELPAGLDLDGGLVSKTMGGVVER